MATPDKGDRLPVSSPRKRMAPARPRMASAPWRDEAVKPGEVVGLVVRSSAPTTSPPTRPHLTTILGWGPIQCGHQPGTKPGTARPPPLESRSQVGEQPAGRRRSRASRRRSSMPAPQVVLASLLLDQRIERDRLEPGGGILLPAVSLADDGRHRRPRKWPFQARSTKFSPVTHPRLLYWHRAAAPLACDPSVGGLGRFGPAFMASTTARCRTTNRCPPSSRTRSRISPATASRRRWEALRAASGGPGRVWRCPATTSLPSAAPGGLPGQVRVRGRLVVPYPERRRTTSSPGSARCRKQPGRCRVAGRTRRCGPSGHRRGRSNIRAASPP